MQILLLIILLVAVSSKAGAALVRGVIGLAFAVLLFILAKGIAAS